MDGQPVTHASISQRYGRNSETYHSADQSASRVLEGGYRQLASATNLSWFGSIAATIPLHQQQYIMMPSRLERSMQAFIQAYSQVVASNTQAAPAMVRRVDSDVSQMRRFLSLLAQDHYPRKMTAVGALRKALSDVLPNARAEVYGSFATPLGIPSSDVDLVICGAGVVMGPHDDGLAAAFSRLEDHLRAQHWVRAVKSIRSTKMPVLKVTAEVAGVRVPLDISFDSPSHNGLSTRAFVRGLCNEYAALAPLTLVLKQFLATKGLNDPYRGGISSYGLVLMIVSVLQRDRLLKKYIGTLRKGAGFDAFKETVHPAMRQLLGGEVFGKGKDLGRLFILFLDTFSRRFHPSVHAIAVPITNDNEDFAFGGGGYRQRFPGDPLVIIDPLDNTNNLGRTCFAFSNVQRAFGEALLAIQENLLRGGAAGKDSAGSAGSPSSSNTGGFPAGAPKVAGLSVHEGAVPSSSAGSYDAKSVTFPHDVRINVAEGEPVGAGSGGGKSGGVTAAERADGPAPEDNPALIDTVFRSMPHESVVQYAQQFFGSDRGFWANYERIVHRIISGRISRLQEEIEEMRQMRARLTERGRFMSKMETSRTKAASEAREQKRLSNSDAKIGVRGDEAALRGAAGQTAAGSRTAGPSFVRVARAAQVAGKSVAMPSSDRAPAAPGAFESRTTDASKTRPVARDAAAQSASHIAVPVQGSSKPRPPVRPQNRRSSDAKSRAAARGSGSPPALPPRHKRPSVVAATAGARSRAVTSDAAMAARNALPPRSFVPTATGEPCELNFFKKWIPATVTLVHPLFCEVSFKLDGHVQHKKIHIQKQAKLLRKRTAAPPAPQARVRHRRERSANQLLLVSARMGGRVVLDAGSTSC